MAQLRNKRTMRAAAAALALFLLLTGCGRTAESSPKEEPQTQEETQQQEPEAPAEEAPAPQEQEPEEPQETPAAPETPAPEEIPEQPQPEQPSKANELTPEELAELWPNGQFTLNGTAYQIPIPQNELLQAGWTISFENTTNPEAFKMQPGEVINAELSLAGYEEAVKVSAEFENLSGGAILLQDCPLTGFYISASVDVKTGTVQAQEETVPEEENGEEAAAKEVQAGPVLPALELPGGITWGSSAEEITAAYGEPTFSGVNQSRFDCMYENRAFYLEFLGDPGEGMQQMIYCVD